MIEKSLHYTLAADATVAGLVGTRIYPLVRRQGSTLPAIVYERVATTPIVTLDGDSGLDGVRIQVSSWATTYADAKVLAKAARDAINASAMKSVTEMEFDDQDDTTKEFRVITDYRIWQR